MCLLGHFISECQTRAHSGPGRGPPSCNSDIGDHLIERTSVSPSSLFYTRRDHFRALRGLSKAAEPVGAGGQSPALGRAALGGQGPEPGLPRLWGEGATRGGTRSWVFPDQRGQAEVWVYPISEGVQGGQGHMVLRTVSGRDSFSGLRWWPMREGLWRVDTELTHLVLSSQAGAPLHPQLLSPPHPCSIPLSPSHGGT